MERSDTVVRVSKLSRVDAICTSTTTRTVITTRKVIKTREGKLTVHTHRGAKSTTAQGAQRLRPRKGEVNTDRSHASSASSDQESKSQARASRRRVVTSSATTDSSSAGHGSVTTRSLGYLCCDYYEDTESEDEVSVSSGRPRDCRPSRIKVVSITSGDTASNRAAEEFYRECDDDKASSPAYGIEESLQECSSDGSVGLSDAGTSSDYKGSSISGRPFLAEVVTKIIHGGAKSQWDLPEVVSSQSAASNSHHFIVNLQPVPSKVTALGDLTKIDVKGNSSQFLPVNDNNAPPSYDQIMAERAYPSVT